jgi:hypothetical protein
MTFTDEQRARFHERIDQLAILDPHMAACLLHMTACLVDLCVHRAPERLRQQARLIGKLRLAPQDAKGGR